VRVAVLAGGRSSEHDVSLDSAASVREGLAAAGHDVTWVDLGRDGSWTCDGEEVALRAGGGLLGADAVFPALHGPFGEDGTVQGMLELLDVAYVGSGVLASALCMDKITFKDVMGRSGLPQVAYWSLDWASPWPIRRRSATRAGSSRRGWARRWGSRGWTRPTTWRRRSRPPPPTTRA
jgi:D-alanine--D-alanine ligase